MEAEKLETPLFHGAPRQSLFEWLSLKEVASDVTPESSRLFSLLQELFQQEGCSVVARGIPHELGGIEWLIIVWLNHAARERFLGSELFFKLEEVLAPRFLKRDMIWPIQNYASSIIQANPCHPPQSLYEILTVYFPVELDNTSVLSLEKLCGPPKWDFEPNWHSPDPVEGFLSEHRAWMDGEVEYRGQPARRLVVFFKFRDEEAEQHYKKNMRWGWRIRDGRKIWEVMDIFLEDLEKLGMLGYDSLHVNFLEVVDYISEHAYFPPRLPFPVTIGIDSTMTLSKEVIVSHGRPLPTESEAEDL